MTGVQTCALPILGCRSYRWCFLFCGARARPRGKRQRRLARVLGELINCRSNRAFRAVLPARPMVVAFAPCANCSSSPFTWSSLSRNSFDPVAHAPSRRSPCFSKHQRLISHRSRQRAPNLSALDRFVLGLTTLFVSPQRLPQPWRAHPARNAAQSPQSVDRLEISAALFLFRTAPQARPQRGRPRNSSRQS